MRLTGLRYSCIVNRLDQLECMVKLVERNNTVVDLLGGLAWRLD